MYIQIIAAYLLILAVSFGGVELFRRWSLKKSLLDVPNERSSHSVPTPRGGGLVIFLVSILALAVYSLVNGREFEWAFCFGASLVAAISLVDDLRAISPFLRIFFHAAAAAAVVWSLGGFDSLHIPFYGALPLGAAGKMLAFVWIVWLINAYNFMDGIDGIAGVQAVTAGFGWAAAGHFLDAGEAAFLGGAIAFSTLGFLFFNWQPAKIFMGDVGSAFLGYSFAVLPLLAKTNGAGPGAEPYLPWLAVTFVWFFVFDTVLTFCRRLFRGERVWKPHREHLYQKMVISGQTHARVTLIYGSLSVALVSAVLLVFRGSKVFENTIFGVIVLETLVLIFLGRYGDRKKIRNLR